MVHPSHLLYVCEQYVTPHRRDSTLSRHNHFLIANKLNCIFFRDQNGISSLWDIVNLNRIQVQLVRMFSTAVSNNRGAAEPLNQLLSEFALLAAATKLCSLQRDALFRLTRSQERFIP